MPQVPTRLKFPQGPDKTLELGVQILDSYWNRNDYEAGGGTVLAARWQHRHSTDVDLFIEPDVYRETYLKNAQSLRDEIYRREAESQLVVTQLDERALEVEFAGLGAMSLVPSPKLTDNQVLFEVEETTGIRLETTVEILAKKVAYRVNNIQWKERDFFDLIVASKCDPSAYTTAINLLGDSGKRNTAFVLRARLSRPYALQRGSIIEPYDQKTAESTWELAADLIEGGEIDIPLPYA